MDSVVKLFAPMFDLTSTSKLLSTEKSLYIQSTCIRVFFRCILLSYLYDVLYIFKYDYKRLLMAHIYKSVQAFEHVARFFANCFVCLMPSTN